MLLAHTQLVQECQFQTVILVFVRPRLFPEAYPGFRQSQASLIWRELEEEEGLDEEGPHGLFHSALRRRQRQGNRTEADRAEGSVRWHRRQKMLDYPDEDCVRYIVLGTLTAVLALFVNLIYPLLSKVKWT